jgi:hypothetical protein
VKLLRTLGRRRILWTLGGVWSGLLVLRLVSPGGTSAFERATLVLFLVQTGVLLLAGAAALIASTVRS